MPRQVKDAKLQTRTARAKLKRQSKPRFREIDPGLHLGYRKGKTGGKWLVRIYLGDGVYRNQTFATADDNADADGVFVLTYGEAQAKARAIAQEVLAAEEGLHIGPYSVKAALDDYLKELEREGRDQRETRRRIGVLSDALGSIKLSKLKKKDIQDWLDAFASSPPKLRNSKPRPVDMNDPEVIRRRRDTANRHLNDLKAALNLAYNEGRAANDRAWRSVKPFRAVSAARVRYLSTNEVTRLLNAAPGDLRLLLQGALLTGARLTDLCMMRAGDFMPDASAVTVGNRKAQYAGKGAFPCYLSDEGMRFFQSLTAGREPGERMFLRADGEGFTSHDVYRPMKATNTAARLNPSATFHTLRHTYASHAVMAGVPLMVVAQNLGHSDTRMVEKHYGHLSPSFARDAIAKGLPKWGIEMDDKVANIR
jgi:integrase